MIAIIVAVVWAASAIFGAVYKAIQEVSKGIREGSVRRAAKRFQNKRAKLACHVKATRPENVGKAERMVAEMEKEFHRLQNGAAWVAERPAWVKREFKRQPFSPRNAFCSEMNVAEIEAILLPEEVPWFEKESAILAQACSYPERAPTSLCSDFNEYSLNPLELGEAVFEFDRSAVSENDVKRFFQRDRLEVERYNEKRLAILSRFNILNSQVQEWNVKQRQRWKRYADDTERMVKEELSNYRLHAQKYVGDCQQQKENISAALQGFNEGARGAVIARVQCIMGSLTMPWSIPRLWDVDFDEEQRILIVEIGLPDVVHRPPIKIVSLKSGPVARPLNQAERKEFIPKVHPAIILRIAFELFRNDSSGIFKLLVVNGWVSFDDPTTGASKKAYTASLMVEHDQFASMNLRRIDPLIAFQSLNGKSAGRLIEIIPIEPVLNLQRSDSRFVDAREVINNLDGSTNLAAMDWQDFEHLIRELFEKEFSGRGGEVKITQASRDRGVDAIVFNPDPIHGGKYIIQAKRYTNTVDVSAVRDLCAVVRKEGASKGILVTTSTYGADAYAFANNEPVTLLNGGELLWLLHKHGYAFRINLQEARRLKQSLAHGDFEVSPG